MLAWYSIFDTLVANAFKLYLIFIIIENVYLDFLVSFDCISHDFATMLLEIGRFVKLGLSELINQTIFGPSNETSAQSLRDFKKLCLL